MNVIGLLTVTALLSIAAHAQAGALPATVDGRGVYSAVLRDGIRQRGSDQSFSPKMYLVRDGQITLVDDTPPTNVLPKLYTRSSVSADGSVVAINRDQVCTVGSFCNGVSFARTDITTPNRTFNFQGRSHLTANGRFAVVYEKVQRLDLETGSVTTVGDLVAPYGRFVAEDGTVLARSPLGCQLFGPSSSAPFDCALSAQHAVLSGDASLIVYDAASPSVEDVAGTHYPWEIQVRNVQSGNIRFLGSGWDPTAQSYLWVNGRASFSCPSLKAKRVSPHVIRHTTAMHLLQSGVDMTVIALWLGHESLETTHGYVQADLQTDLSRQLEANPGSNRLIIMGLFKREDKIRLTTNYMAGSVTLSAVRIRSCMASGLGNLVTSIFPLNS